MSSKSKSTRVTRGGGSKATKSKADEEEEEAYSSSEGTGSVEGGYKSAMNFLYTVPSPEDDNNDNAQPGKKKWRKSTTRTKSKGKSKVSKKAEGKLAKLLELPVDILTEVASHLDPLSLLYLSRTSKSFHRLLASRASTSIWQSSRDKVGLPDLEADDLTKMQYASLLYEKICHVCRKDRAQIVNFDVRRRYCKPCQRDHLISNGRVSSQIVRLGSAVHNYMPELGFKTRNGPNKAGETDYDLYHFSNALALNTKLNQLQAASGVPDEITHQDYAVWYGRQREKRERVKQGEAEFKPEEKELEDFVKQRRELVEAVQNDAANLKKWVKDGAQDRGKTLNDAKTARRKAIEDKLESLGYDKRDLDVSDYTVKKVVVQATPLSDAIWTRISKDLVPRVEAHRDKRLEQERLQRRQAAQNKLWRHYSLARTSYQADPSTKSQLFPSMQTFLDLTAVRPFWEPEPSTPIDNATWASVELQVVAEAKTVHRSFKLQLARHVAASLAGTPHALPTSIESRLLPPADVESSWVASVTDQELEDLFKPFTRQVSCGACPASSLMPTRMTTLDRLVDHVSTIHSLVELGDLNKWYDPRWAGIATDALQAAGIDDKLNANEVHPQARELTWQCDECEEYKDELYADEEDECGGFGYGYGTGRQKSGLTWSEILDHVYFVHLRTPYSVLPHLSVVQPGQQSEVPYYSLF
ncbi:hypothetical protein JCM8097_002028 [Rhodosporidiobolus ruineniae]